ncbi:MAG: hypothetical protein ABI539_05385 [Acidobacteriota bacterium]
MSWSVEEIVGLKGYAIEWAEPGSYYLSRRNVIYHSTDLVPPFKKVAVVDAPVWKSVAARSRLAQRLLRFMITNVVPVGDGRLFVTFDKTVGIVEGGRFRPLSGLVRPCRVLRAACALDSRGDIYFGEYLANAERGQMRIYRYSAGDDALTVAYTFPAGSIKHIHGVYFDAVENALYCLTGDEEKECRIIKSDDGFETLNSVGEGDETWRAVSILFDQKAFYYGMDAEYRANHIYKVERSTLERTSLGEVNGTVFYSKRIGEDLFFTTTAENAPSQTENVAAIWNIGPDQVSREIIKFQKDRWHKSLFQFGTIHFPYVNKLENELYFQVVAVRGDAETFRLYRK